MKSLDLFEWIFNVGGVLLICSIVTYAIVYSGEKEDACLAKSCEIGAPFYDEDTGNCFCAEVPK